MGVNKNLKFSDCSQKISQWFHELKREPKFGEKVRILIMGYMIGFSLLYAGYTLKIEPMQKEYAQKARKYLNTANLNSVTKADIAAKVRALMTTEYARLKKQDEILKTQAEIMQLHADLSDKIWQNKGDEQSFLQVVLSLLPNSPAPMGQGMARLNQLPVIKQDGYKIFPVSLNGHGSYDRLLTYFKYLESRSEIGLFDKITINSENSGKPGQDLNFSIQVGRIQVEKSL